MTFAFYFTLGAWLWLVTAMASRDYRTDENLSKFVPAHKRTPFAAIWIAVAVASLAWPILFVDAWRNWRARKRVRKAADDVARRMRA